MNKVVNTTVLSNFAAVGRLDVLRDTALPLYLPSEVHHELLEGQMAGYRFYDNIEQHIYPFDSNGWLHLVAMTNEELRLSALLPTHLHQGERACLCIARQRGWGFLSDDRTARRQAVAWNIPLSGTLGVLSLAVQDGRLDIDRGNILLGEMIKRANYRSPTTDLKLLLP